MPMSLFDMHPLSAQGGDDYDCKDVPVTERIPNYYRWNACFSADCDVKCTKCCGKNGCTPSSCPPYGSCGNPKWNRNPLPGVVNC